mmetsp:Transcript_6212/g.12622  ORF Transcript_6212/g.12622 Transcript_6212/m.12622 type:complete len:89 (-) Transcript_6212:287-553(-)
MATNVLPLSPLLDVATLVNNYSHLNHSRNLLAQSGVKSNGARGSLRGTHDALLKRPSQYYKSRFNGRIRMPVSPPGYGTGCAFPFMDG